MITGREYKGGGRPWAEVTDGQGRKSAGDLMFTRD